MCAHTKGLRILPLPMGSCIFCILVHPHDPTAQAVAGLVEARGRPMPAVPTVAAVPTEARARSMQPMHAVPTVAAVPMEPRARPMQPMPAVSTVGAVPTEARARAMRSMCAVPAVDPTAVVATATVQAVLAFSQLLRSARAVHLVSTMVVYLVVAEARAPPKLVAVTAMFAVKRSYSYAVAS